MESIQGWQDHSCSCFYFKFYCTLRYPVSIFRHAWMMSQLCVLKWFHAVVGSFYLFCHVRGNNWEFAACLPCCIQGNILTFSPADSVYSLNYIIPLREVSLIMGWFGKQSSLTFFVDCLWSCVQTFGRCLWLTVGWKLLFALPKVWVLEQGALWGSQDGGGGGRVQLVKWNGAKFNRK